jgi:NAD(P)-dependent dehydrogenase (short-subunit alcohol dehydrogenase family)
MGETADELKPHLNGHAGTTIAGQNMQENNSNHTPEPGDNIDAIRAQIEETRDDLSETIDALQSRLDPQRVKEQFSEKIHEATVERAQNLAQTAKETLARARDKAGEALAPAIESVQNLTQRDGTTETSSESATQLKPLYEQVVVVFGASSGIGRETAIQFARNGAKVVVAARSEEGLSSLVESIRNAGGTATYQVADVTDLAQVQAVAQKAVDEFGRLDTWVHCAGISLYATAEDTTSEEFRRILEVNLVGTMHGALAALPHLKREGRGALICISSVEGKRAFPYQSAYASSKHGIIGFLDALRMELQHEGSHISVTNVMPAGINTPFFNHARTKLGVKPQPAPPIYQPSVVAEAILHAAQNPTRDIAAGGASKMMAAGQLMAPALMDAVVARTGFESQKTKEPKPNDAPDNFYEPLKGYNHVGGDFMKKAKDKSLGTWLEIHPKAQLALKGAAFGLALMFLLRRK